MALGRKIALIDLNRRHIDTFPVSVDCRDRFLGGRGLATYLMCKYASKKCYPLSAANVFVVSAGLLGGTLSTPLGYTIVTTKSATTGLMASACLNGPFATEMRQAGFDHLVFTGRAESPTYLFVHDGHIELRDATGYADKTAGEQKTIPCDAASGRAVRWLCTQKASDDQIIFGDRFVPLEAKASGIGAVLAAKNMQAVACRGTLDIEVKDPKGCITYESKSRPRLMADESLSKDLEGATMGGPAGAVDWIEIFETVAQCLGLPFRTQVDLCASDLMASSARIQLNTGMVLNEDDLKEIAYRCITMERIFNIREGIAKKGGRKAAEYREGGWNRKAVMKKGQVFDRLKIGDLWDQLKS